MAVPYRRMAPTGRGRSVAYLKVHRVAQGRVLFGALLLLDAYGHPQEFRGRPSHKDCCQVGRSFPTTGGGRQVEVASANTRVACLGRGPEPSPLSPPTGQSGEDGAQCHPLNTATRSNKDTSNTPCPTKEALA